MDILVCNLESGELHIVSEEYYKKAIKECSTVIPRCPEVYVTRCCGIDFDRNGFELTTISKYYEEINSYTQKINWEIEVVKSTFEFDDYTVYETRHDLWPHLALGWFYLYRINRKIMNFK